MTMNTKLKYLPIAAFAAIALTLAGCGGGGGGSPVASMPGPDEPVSGPDEPVLTELEKAQTAAAAAATAAMTAAGNANTAATAAETARANAATLQTGETSEGLAEKAREQADMAHTAYMDAKAASEAAAAATDVTSAVRAQVMAENAQADAETAETKAGEYGQDAEDAANDDELMIVDAVKSVGGTSLDAEAGANVLTTGEGDDAQTTRTGEIKGMAPMTTGDGADTGVAGEQDNPATDADDAVKHVQQVADRTFAIGKVVDSADDTARLMIVTQYAGSKNGYVHSLQTTTVMGTKAGRLSLNDGVADNEDVNNVALKSEGMSYRGGTDTGELGEDDEVGAETQGCGSLLVRPSQHRYQC